VGTTYTLKPSVTAVTFDATVTPNGLTELLGYITWDSGTPEALPGQLTPTGNGGDGSIESPYTEHGMWYMGFKAGLDSWSSDQEFDDALNEIWQDYTANNPSTIDDVANFNGISYSIINWENITGGVPEYVYNTFWKDLYEQHHYSIGSCWLFNYVEISSKDATGTIYEIDAIVTSTEGGGYIRYHSSKATLSPMESRNLSLVNQANVASYFYSPFNGDIRDKFYATNASNGTPGTYTTTAPVSGNSVWTRQ
jgi:hypothetical protein